MKTYKNLYPRIVSFPNLYKAFRAARKGKRDRAAVSAFEFDLEGNLLARRIGDAQTMWLVDQILNSGAGILADEYTMTYFPGDDLFAVLRPRGLPIGNLTSQFWANVDLHELDKFAKHELRCSAYLRYMDDFVLFADSKRELHIWRAQIEAFLATHLRLVMHPRKSTVIPTRTGLDFCGFRLYPTHRRLRRSAIRRFVRRFRRQRELLAQGEMTLAELTTSISSWIAHAEHGDTWRLRERIFNDYPLRVPYE